jgi:hypothetical protein
MPAVLIPLENPGELPQIMEVELRGALGTHTIPGPIRSLREPTLTETLVSDTRCPPIRRAQRIVRSDGYCGSTSLSHGP